MEALAQAVLDERAEWPASSLADLYDPDTMPQGLRAAHAKLDGAVDRLYRPAGFADERERVEHLFQRCERLVDPVSAAPRLNRSIVAKARAAAQSGGQTGRCAWSAWSLSLI